MAVCIMIRHVTSPQLSRVKNQNQNCVDKDKVVSYSLFSFDFVCYRTFHKVWVYRTVIYWNLMVFLTYIGVAKRGNSTCAV